MKLVYHYVFIVSPETNSLIRDKNGRLCVPVCLCVLMSGKILSWFVNSETSSQSIA